MEIIVCTFSRVKNTKGSSWGGAEHIYIYIYMCRRKFIDKSDAPYIKVFNGFDRLCFVCPFCPVALILAQSRLRAPSDSPCHETKDENESY